jgi:hypothetical protein
MFIKGALVSLIFLMATAQAAVKFNCYENPNMGPLAYQLGGQNCGTGISASLDDTSKIFCTYSAICEALGPDEKPTKLTPEQIRQYTESVFMNNSGFKHSMVSCPGTGKLDPGDKTLYGKCPPINECAKDIAFNGGPANVTSQPSTESATVTSPNANKGSR